MEEEACPPKPSVATKPSLTLKRRLNAAPEKVYAAWTEPEKIVKWFGPDAGPVTQAEADVRVGGRYARHLPHRGRRAASRERRLREVVPNEKLVFTWAWRTMPERESLVTILIKPDGDGLAPDPDPRAILRRAARDRHQEGWTGCLDKLERYLA